jgi:hypothetical protein
MPTSDSTTSAFGKSVLGVLRLDGWGDDRTTGTGGTDHDGSKGYVPLRGDIDDVRSFNSSDSFTVIAEIAKGCTWDALKNADQWEDNTTKEGKAFKKDTETKVSDALKVLIEADADVIIANCGLFMWLHATGIITPAMDRAMEAIEKDRKTSTNRPIVSLSTLTTLPSLLPLYGLGSAQKDSTTASGFKKSKAIVVIYTSNEAACLAILNAMEQLKGASVFVHTRDQKELDANKERGGILVIGLNGKNVIGVNGKVEGFEVVNNGTPAYYDVLQPSMKTVAEGVAKEYPNIIFGVVECTEVGAYTDTIRAAMGVPVYDPILMADAYIKPCIDHGYDQLNNDDRNEYVELALSYPVNPNFFVDLADGKEEPPGVEVEDAEGPAKKKRKTGKFKGMLQGTPKGRFEKMKHARKFNRLKNHFKGKSSECRRETRSESTRPE